MLLLLLQSAGFPWWVTLIGTVTGIGLGIMGAMPWRSTAQAAKEAAEVANGERDNLRKKRDELQHEIVELNAEIKVLKARTDLNGLREEFRVTILKLTDEFKHHSEQDALNAQQQVAATVQQTAALEAVKETLKVVQGQMKN